MAIIIPRPRIKPRLGARLDRQHPLSRGIAGCWLFNEMGGAKLLDLSGYSRHGSISLSSYRFDQLGVSCTNLGSFTDWISWSNLPQIGTTPGLDFTVAVTILATSFTDSYENLFAQSNSTGLYARSTGYVAVYTGSAINSNATLVVGTTYQVVWTYTVSGSTHSIYINGHRDKTFSATTTFTPDRSLNDSSSETFDGRMSYASLWARALTASEVRWLYTEPYANVVQPVYRRYFIQSGATFQPAWAMRSSHVIGVTNA